MPVLVHTGQHYDVKMSELFSKELGTPKSDANRGIGSGARAEQVGRTMIKFEEVSKKHGGASVLVGNTSAGSVPLQQGDERETPSNASREMGREDGREDCKDADGGLRC